MKKLNADQLGKQEQFAKELTELFNNVEEHFGRLEDHVREYNLVVDEFNTKLNDVKEFVSEVATAMDEYFDDRSDSWKEGDAGAAYEGWKEEWTAYDADDLEHVELGNVTDTSASGAADALTALPQEPTE